MEQRVDRVGEAGELGLPTVGSREVGVLREQHRTADTGALAGFDIGGLVAEHQRAAQVDAQRLCTAQDHAGRGLAAVAVDGVAGDGAVRQVRTVLDGVQRHQELLALSGERQRRERREALRNALEAEYPGISTVTKQGDVFVIPEDPWSSAAELGLLELDPSLEPS